MLPEATDEWAAEASEFDTLAELRADLAERMTTVRKMQAQMALRDKVGEAAAELVDLEVPEPLVDGEMQQRLAGPRHAPPGPGHRRSTSGWPAPARTRASSSRSCATRPTQAAKVDLALRAVADAEQIEATDDDLDAEFAPGRRAARARRPTRSAQQFERRRPDRARYAPTSGGARRSTGWSSTVEIVDEDGNPIDRADLELARRGRRRRRRRPRS